YATRGLQYLKASKWAQAVSELKCAKDLFDFVGYFSFDGYENVAVNVRYFIGACLAEQRQFHEACDEFATASQLALAREAGRDFTTYPSSSTIIARELYCLIALGRYEDALSKAPNGVRGAQQIGRRADFVDCHRLWALGFE